MASAAMHVPPSLRAEIIASEAQFCREIPRWDPTDAIDRLIANADGAYTLLQPFLRPGLRVLEIGSGNGFGLCVLLQRGVEAVGVEPGNTPSFQGRYERARTLLAANGLTPSDRLVPACGEDLPFPNGTFDLVFSIAVLEHVSDPGLVLREAIRVTKPGGFVLMNVPNYASWYEGHYIIPWCPWLPYLRSGKRLARWYVRTIWRRPDYYVDQLNFTTPTSVRRALSSCAGIQTRIYPFAMGPFGAFSSLDFFLSTGGTSHHAVVSWLREWPVVGRTAHLVARVVSRGAAALGLAPVFNVVIQRF